MSKSVNSAGDYNGSIFAVAIDSVADILERELQPATCTSSAVRTIICFCWNMGLRKMDSLTVYLTAVLAAAHLSIPQRASFHRR